MRQSESNIAEALLKVKLLCEQGEPLKSAIVSAGFSSTNLYYYYKRKSESVQEGGDLDPRGSAELVVNAAPTVPAVEEVIEEGDGETKVILLSAMRKIEEKINPKTPVDESCKLVIALIKLGQQLSGSVSHE
jgi:hypothetical protein